jgi:hypothetical protein
MSDLHSWWTRTLPQSVVPVSMCCDCATNLFHSSSSCVNLYCSHSCIPQVNPQRLHDFHWQSSAWVKQIVRSSYLGRIVVTTKCPPQPTHLPLIHRVDSTDRLVSRGDLAASFLYSGYRLVVWAQKGPQSYRHLHCSECRKPADIHKHDSTRCPLLWHEPRLANSSYAWSQRLCGITLYHTRTWVTPLETENSITALCLFSLSLCSVTKYCCGAVVYTKLIFCTIVTITFIWQMLEALLCFWPLHCSLRHYVLSSGWDTERYWDTLYDVVA